MSRPVLLLDVMSTLVYDPFRVELPDFLGMTFAELIACKAAAADPNAWVRFERQEITEAEFFELYLPPGSPPIDSPGLRRTLHSAYRFIDGIEPLLARLREAGIEMHALSNYPIWYTLIEDKLALSRYLEWSFVSWNTRVRKPNPRAYLDAAQTLERDPGACLFVDDRESNCQAAREVGMPAVRFESAEQLEAELHALRVLG